MLLFLSVFCTPPQSCPKADFKIAKKRTIRQQKSAFCYDFEEIASDFVFLLLWCIKLHILCFFFYHGCYKQYIYMFLKLVFHNIKKTDQCKLPLNIEKQQ